MSLDVNSLQQDIYVITYEDETIFVTTNPNNIGQSSIQWQDEGVDLGTAGTVNEIDFTGSGVSATRSGSKVTVDIPSVSSASSTFMFYNGSGSGISGYKDLISLPSYTAGALASTPQIVTTAETLLEEFATISGVPSITVIPIGTIFFHYDIQKASGGQSFYSYAKLYKRDASNVETLIATSDPSTTNSLNTQQQVDVSVVITSAITLASTNRLVVKIYAIMLTASATISVVYDDTTNARLTIPVNISSIVGEAPYWSLASGGTLTGNNTITQAGFNTTFSGIGKVTFSPTTGLSGMNVGSFAGVPSVTTDGDIFNNSVAGFLQAKRNGTVAPIIQATTTLVNGRIAVVSNAANITDYSTLTFDGTGLLVGGGTITGSTRVDLRGIGTTTNNTLRLADSSNTATFLFTDAGNLYGLSGTTGMTNGFINIPSAAGAPSGTPTVLSGRVPMYYDTTNNQFYIYNAAWKKVTLA